MKVKFANDEFPKDTEFDIGGLLLVNKKEVTFNDEEVESFETRNGRTLADALAGINGVTVDGKENKVKYEEVKEEEPVEEEGEN